MPRARKKRALHPRLRLFLPMRSLRIQVIAIAAAIAAAIASAQSFASAREAAATYLIQPGDTLLAIAVTTGVPVDRLTSLNDLHDPDVIIAGRTLQLQDGTSGQQAVTSTSSSASTAGAAAGNYTVKSGDTLWDISSAARIPVDELVKINNLSDVDHLSVGQQLKVPNAPAAAASAKPKPTPTPKPQPQLQPRPSAVQQKIAAEVQRVGGANVRVGVAALNLGTGERVAIHAEETFPSASVMKLPILVELERQVAAGALTWNDGLRADATAMIAVSDNNAANNVARAVSSVAVNDTLKKLGLAGTKFLNLFDDARSPAHPGQNQTTPSNMLRLLELVATDQIVNASVSGDIRAMLAKNADRSKLVRLLPNDARVAHKSGWYDGVANDVGIVSVERSGARWALAVFTEKVADAETGNQLVATISRAVYDAWAGQ